MATAESPIRVILIDDHRHIHQAVTTILAENSSIELVAQGSNGQEAIALCQEHQPDLVLMDVVMPTMNGVTATQTIRERFPDIRILVLSSFQDHESVHEMLRSGASGYVTKSALAAAMAVPPALAGAARQEGAVTGTISDVFGPRPVKPVAGVRTGIASSSPA